MAEDKKSFVLYSDLIHTVKKMSKEDAGELFLHLLEYVNDDEPTTENMIVELTFEPIKQQLKRDLLKWGGIREKRSNAGKISAEKRKKKKEEENSTQPTHVKSVEQKSTSSTVSVSVSVNDNVNDIIKKGVDEAKHAIFKNWFEYRKEIKKPIKGIKSLKAVIKKFNSQPLELLIKVVNNSIENGYQGLIWDKYKNNGNQTGSNTSNNNERPHNIERQTFTEES